MQLTSHILPYTIRLDNSELQGDVEMTLATSGAYRSTTDDQKINIMTQQGHVLKIDGAAGTAALVMNHREYGSILLSIKLHHHLNRATLTRQPFGTARA